MGIKHLVLVLALLGLALIVTVVFLNETVDMDVDAQENSYEVPFPSVNGVLNIRARSWGLGHSEIIISDTLIQNKHREYDPKHQYTYLNTTELYYKVEEPDTLVVYVDYPCDSPESFSDLVTVKQISIGTADMVAYYEKNYKKMGLTKVDVYEE
ncbi:MAG: hypothetical protein K9J06_08585 [Flavobacteriales bacterium]|nr:hypothetical protein [Flavobacteriales bacterium]